MFVLHAVGADHRHRTVQPAARKVTLADDAEVRHGGLDILAQRGGHFAAARFDQGAGRFVVEGMRNTGFILMLGKSISISQLVSVIAVVAGGVLYAVLYARSKTLKAAAYEGQFAERFDDTDMLESAYNLLGVEWDCSDDELEAAYSDKRGFFSSVEADGDDRQAKVAAKLDELEKAYDYIVNSRRLEAEEDGEASDSAESEAAVAESGTAEGDTAEIPAEGDSDGSGAEDDTDGSGTDGAEG